MSRGRTSVDTGYTLNRFCVIYLWTPCIPNAIRCNRAFWLRKSPIKIIGIPHSCICMIMLRHLRNSQCMRCLSASAVPTPAVSHEPTISQCRPRTTENVCGTCAIGWLIDISYWEGTDCLEGTVCLDGDVLNVYHKTSPVFGLSAQPRLDCPPLVRWVFLRITDNSSFCLCAFIYVHIYSPLQEGRIFFAQR